ncbi:tripartite tricarboxylate transporter TctB family protein [Desulfitibacter alkalitolerans]|uniref:tripartite tricarboxylate transporter TctB family protein n=1 Tax=Desulfitibacter alkalitolerans TaxID=264641 RepID=UPI000683FECA|nr:tripartite tricarboxylate transporter TctB family protein [Desulfitibacter alkalitolerans]
MRRLKADIILLCILCLVSIFLYYKSLNFPKGADTFPQVLIIIVLILSVYQIAASFIKKEAFQPQREKQEKSLQISWNQKYSSYIIFIFSVAYAVLITRLGFFISTAIFISTAMWFLGARKLTAYVFSTLGISLFIYFLFVMQLKVPLPKGILF